MLRDLIGDGKKLAPARAVHIALQVLMSLGEAHAKGICHRDIKPSNILLLDQFGHADHVKVLDFGIAQDFSSGQDTSGLLGTPTYMAPEQCLGEALGPTTDLYAVGCVLYEALGGLPPFVGADKGQTHAMAVVYAHISKQPVPLLRRFGPICPEPLAELVQRLLEKMPSDRPQSAEAVVAELEAIRSSTTLPTEIVELPEGAPAIKHLSETVTLPRRGEPALRGASAPRKARTTSVGRRLTLPAASASSVLIIDDNADNLRVAVDLLEAYSVKVRTARDGMTGIRRAKTSPTGLILLDVEMPGIDGYETCRRLKSDEDLAAIPVIFMTARTTVEDKVRAFEVGGIDYVSKPFEARELVARVQTHLALYAFQVQMAEEADALAGQVAEQEERLSEVLASRDSIETERKTLIALVRRQSEELQRLTEQWENRLETPTAASRAHVQARLTLIDENLRQARTLLPRDEATAQAINHLEMAKSLLEPLLAKD